MDKHLRERLSIVPPTYVVIRAPFDPKLGLTSTRFKMRNLTHGATANDLRPEAGMDPLTTIVGLLPVDGVLEATVESDHRDAALLLTIITTGDMGDVHHHAITAHPRQEDMMETRTILEDRHRRQFEAMETRTPAVIRTADPGARPAMAMLVATATRTDDTRLTTPSPPPIRMLPGTTEHETGISLCDGYSVNSGKMQEPRWDV
jgi:hypothetical protein